MKLIKLAGGELTDTKEVPGLLTSRIDYEIKSGKGRLEYSGPKFTREMWHQVLSFFRWTNKEMDSESQVRLYVNTKLGRWGAWAFPQEARTGMSAKEITVQETPEQAVERFASWDAEPSGDWLYFCTVHHHCSASAFQSGTDEENERNQDGLHITVGRMDGDRHDLHARFYLGENCFEPDLSLFWPVEAELAEKLPPSLHDAIARHQMCEKVVVDFPDAWRKNIMEVKREGRGFDGVGRAGEWDMRQLDLPEWMRAERALAEITGECHANSVQEEECVAALHFLTEDPVANIILEACLKHHVTPDYILGEMQQPELGY